MDACKILSTFQQIKEKKISLPGYIIFVRRSIRRILSFADIL